MDSIAVFLLILIIALLVIVVFLIFNPTFQIMPYPVMPRPIRPHRVMPQFGPYWAHGGQTNSGLLY